MDQSQSQFKEALAQGIPIGAPLQLTGSITEYLEPDLSDARLKKQFFYTASGLLPLINADTNLVMCIYGDVSARAHILKKWGDKKSPDYTYRDIELMALGQASRGIKGFTAGQLTTQNIRIQENPQKKQGLLGRLF